MSARLQLHSPLILPERRLVLPRRRVMRPRATFPMPFVLPRVSAAAAVTAEYIGGSALTAGTSTTHTLSMSGGGLIVICANAGGIVDSPNYVRVNNSSGLAATSIGGNSGTQARASLWYIRIASGTTVTRVDVSWNDTSGYRSVQVYRLANTTADAPTAQSTPGGAGSAGRSVSVSTQAGGIMIATAAHNSSLVTFSGVTGSQSVAISSAFAGGLAYTTTATAQTLTSTSTCNVIVGAAWR